MKNLKSILISVSGGSGSGKTTVAERIKNQLNARGISAQIVCLDNFYENDDKKIPKINGNKNFDHPNAFDWTLIKNSLKKLLNNETTGIPIYDYQHSIRTKEIQLLKPTQIIILEGILALHDPEINNMCSLKIYVETSNDERFIRRLKRDISERNRTIDSVINQWRTMVIPMHKYFVEPLKNNADIIIPWFNNNEIGINAINAAISSITEQK